MKLLENKLIKTPVKYGLVGSLLFLVGFFILILMNREPIGTSRVFDFFIIPLILFFAMKEFRDFKNDRVLHFWQGMSVGVICYVSMGLLSAMFLYPVLRHDDNRILNQYIEEKTIEIKENKERLVKQFDEATYEEVLKNIQTANIFDIMQDNFLKKCLIGMILTIMMAVILRKTPKPQKNE